MGTFLGGDTATLKAITNSFEASAVDYMKSYKGLEEIITTLTTNGTLSGNPAEVLVQKFNEKKDTFQELYNILEECRKKMDEETIGLKRVIDDLQYGMR